MTNGADVLSNELLSSLLVGENFTIPNLDLDTSEYSIPNGTGTELYTNVVKLTNADLTTRLVNGTGTFDALMQSAASHLKIEYDANRITGAEYAKAYSALVQSAMQNAVQYLLGKDQAYWQGVQAQIAAITAKVALASAKVQYIALRAEAATQKANYALTKIKLANEDIVFASTNYKLTQLDPLQKSQMEEQVAGLQVANSTASYNLSDMLPKQALLLDKQVDGQTTANNTALYNLSDMLPKQVDLVEQQVIGQTTTNSTATYNLATMLPKQANLLDAQTSVQTAQSANVTKDTSIKDYTLVSMLPVQRNLLLEQVTGQTKQNLGLDKDIDIKDYNLTYMLPAQRDMTLEQVESQRAQTMDTRTNGVTVVTGVLGKQKELYTKQIDSFTKDAQYKAAKIVADAWMTRFGVDSEILDSPLSFTPTQYDTILTTLFTTNGLLP